MATAIRGIRGIIGRAIAGATMQPCSSSIARARRFSTTPHLKDEEEDMKVRGLFPAAVVHEEDYGNGAKQYVMHHPDIPGVKLATIGFMQREGQMGMMHGTAVHSALPFISAVKLVKHVMNIADQPPIAAAGKYNMTKIVNGIKTDSVITSCRSKNIEWLPGLCEWVSALPEAELQEEFGDELAEAVTAIATGKPRPGHSVLGQGTFTAAEPAWMVLAGRYANEPEAEEVRLFHAAGYSKDIKLQPMADTSQDGMARSGGTMALLRVAPN